MALGAKTLRADGVLVAVGGIPPQAVQVIEDLVDEVLALRAELDAAVADFESRIAALEV